MNLKDFSYKNWIEKLNLVMDSLILKAADENPYTMSMLLVRWFGKLNY